MNKEHVNIASIDIKGAYDGVDHLVLFEKLEKWRKLGILDHQTIEYVRFLYSQYKLGLVESKKGNMDQICLVNVGVP